MYPITNVDLAIETATKMAGDKRFTVEVWFDYDSDCYFLVEDAAANPYDASLRNCAAVCMVEPNGIISYLT